MRGNSSYAFWHHAEEATGRGDIVCKVKRACAVRFSFQSEI